MAATSLRGRKQRQGPRTGAQVRAAAMQAYRRGTEAFQRWAYRNPGPFLQFVIDEVYSGDDDPSRTALEECLADFIADVVVARRWGAK